MSNGRSAEARRWQAREIMAEPSPGFFLIGPHEECETQAARYNSHMSSNVELWARFGEVAAVRFTSTSYSGIGWSGVGSGLVKVSEPAPNVLVLSESGVWQQDGGKELRFSNVFRWTLMGERLRLEHLRFGEGKPVFLFDMAADADGAWREVNPHPCRDDCYRASVRLQDERIFINWLVRGPEKNEVIDYVYV